MSIIDILLTHVVSCCNDVVLLNIIALASKSLLLLLVELLVGVEHHVGDLGDGVGVDGPAGVGEEVLEGIQSNDVLHQEEDEREGEDSDQDAKSEC